MRAQLLVLLLAACPNRPGNLGDKREGAVVYMPVPTVERAEVLGQMSSGPSYHVVLDASGGLRLGTMPIDPAGLERYMSARYPMTDDVEPGGSGTPMTLDTKPCSNRAEGNVRAPPLSPELEGRLIAGVRGIQVPGRAARIAGQVMHSEAMSPQRAMVFAAPTAKAVALIEVITTTRAAIAVTHAGRIEPLRIDFVDQDDRYPAAGPPQAVRFRIDADTDVAMFLARTKLTRMMCDHEVIYPIDLLVSQDVEVQQLVDVLVRLDQEGVRMIGLGIADS